MFRTAAGPRCRSRQGGGKGDVLMEEIKKQKNVDYLLVGSVPILYGLTAMILAFHAGDPGSIPGREESFFAAPVHSFRSPLTLLSPSSLSLLPFCCVFLSSPPSPPFPSFPFPDNEGNKKRTLPHLLQVERERERQRLPWSGEESKPSFHTSPRKEVPSFILSTSKQFANLADCNSA